MVATAKFRIEGEDATAAAFRMALGNAQGTAGKMQAIFRTAFAGISVAAIVGVGARAIETGDNLNKAAIKAGVGAKAISELAYAAKMSDIELDSLSTALKKMQVNLSEAATGGKAQQESLNALGIELKDIKGLAADKQFELIADRISQLKDPAERARAATELFGKAGADLLPMFEQGAEGIRKARIEAERMGLSFNDTQLKALADADDAVKRLKASWEGFAVALTAKAAPAISEILSLLHGDANGVFGGGGRRDGTPAEQLAFAESRLALAKKGSGSSPEYIRELTDEIERLNMVINGVDDFASRRARAAQGGAGAVGYRGPSNWDQELKDMTELSRVMVSGKKVGLQNQVDEYTDVLKQAQGDNEDFVQSLKDINKKGIDLVDDQIDAQVRLQEANSAMRDSWIERDEEMARSSKKTFMDMSVYADQAARNMQDALADFLFDPFHDGLKGMLSDFINIIRRMAAEAAAAQIFGSKESGGFGLGDFLRLGIGSALGGGSGTSGGGAASMDPLGDEYSGLAAGAGYSSLSAANASQITVAPVYQVDARGATPDVIKQLPAILEENSRRTVQMAKAEMYDDMSRRGLLRG